MFKFLFESKFLGFVEASVGVFPLYYAVLSLCGGWVVVVSKRLLSLNPTTVFTVLLLLGSDNMPLYMV